MKLYLKLFICVSLIFSLSTVHAITKKEYTSLVTELVDKVVQTKENSDDLKLKLKFRASKNSTIKRQISYFDSNPSNYTKEEIKVLDDNTKIYIYRYYEPYIDYKFATIIIPDEGLTKGHPAIIDVEQDGFVMVAVDLKRFLLEKLLDS